MNGQNSLVSFELKKLGFKKGPVNLFHYGVEYTVGMIQVEMDKFQDKNDKKIDIRDVDQVLLDLRHEIDSNIATISSQYSSDPDYARKFMRDKIDLFSSEVSELLNEYFLD